MKNLLKTLIILIILSPLSLTLSSCEYFVDVWFDIATTPQDTLIVQRWGDYNCCDTIPYTNLPETNWEETVSRIRVGSANAMGGRYTSVSEESSFATLLSQIDSIRIIRKSDNASTITFRHDENATEAQRYFFTREAWDCDPPDEKMYSRTYTFKFTDDMFH